MIKQTCDKVIVNTCIQLPWNSRLAPQAQKSQFHIITFLGEAYAKSLVKMFSLVSI